MLRGISRTKFRSIVMLISVVILLKNILTFLRHTSRHTDVVRKPKLGNSFTSNVSKPNILFILADDYGYNDIGYHGSEIKTPNLDKLAMSGVRLENYYVQPICTPTRSQLLTGRYQIHTGLQSGVIWPTEPSSIPLDSKTIADKLSDAGYSTHMVGKWHLGYHKREYLPTRRGFHSFFGFLNGHNDYFSYQSRYKTYKGFDLRENEDPAEMKKYHGKYSTHVLTEKAIDIFKQDRTGKPFFVYLAFQAPHTPLQVPEYYLNQYKHIQQTPGRKTYAAMVSCMDEGVGNITRALKDLGVWDNTLLIFSSDNGAEYGSGSNRPLRGFKGSYWEGAIKAVGFVHGKLLNHELIGSVSKELLHVTDWFPTLVNLAGGDFNGTKPLDGHDQRECIFEGKSSKRKEILINIDPVVVAPGRPLFNNTFDTTISASIRLDKWKLLTGTTKGGPSRRPRNPNLWLMNIEKDPHELEDLSDQYPSLVQYMLKRLQYYQSTAVPVVKPRQDTMADPALLGGFWGPWLDE
ncbi:arylsulfatase J-like [Mercenaria mercenaria]|uniref:arylsulfatase J-like n=1 Tax=Mercenaria mercenaria TaxID=6596 RepID=UPI00234F07C6|nr:arylsulfatase J-like [Mercenaria mercenaria]